MALIRKLALVLLSAVVSSCATPPPGSNDPQPRPAPEIIEKTEYRQGRTVVNPYPVPDSDIVAEPPGLSTEHITGDNITPEAAMSTAISWAGSYHTVKDQYNTLRGWVAGVAAGTAMVQKALDEANPDAPGVPKNSVPLIITSEGNP